MTTENTLIIIHTHDSGSKSEGGPLDYQEGMYVYAVSDEVYLITDPENTRGDEVLDSDWCDNYEEWWEEYGDLLDGWDMIDLWYDFLEELSDNNCD